MNPIEALIAQMLQPPLPSSGPSPAIGRGAWLALAVKPGPNGFVEIQWHGARLRVRWPEGAPAPQPVQWFELVEVGPPIVLMPRTRAELVQRLAERLQQAAAHLAETPPAPLPLVASALPWRWQIVDEDGRPSGGLAAEAHDECVRFTGRVDFPALDTVHFQIDWQEDDCAIHLAFTSPEARCEAQALLPQWQARLAARVVIAS